MKCSLGISSFLEVILIFPILLFSSISLHWWLRKAFLSFLAILNSDDYIYYCGWEYLRRNGIALIVNKTVWNAVFECNLKNNRMISVCFQGKPFNITVIQVCAPTSNAEEVEWPVYEDLKGLSELTPEKDILFITGDWNAKIGSQEIPGVTGKFGLGVQNDVRQRLTKFCQEITLFITNTLFQQHKRQLYTSVQFSHSVQFSSVQSLSRVQLFAIPWITARLASCPSSFSGVHSDSLPLSLWCHLAISSLVITFSSCPKSLPASESFPMSRLFA